MHGKIATAASPACSPCSIEEQPAVRSSAAEGPDWTGQEKLTSEKEMLGFYVTGHPLDQYMDKVAELATHDTSNLEGLDKGTEVALCGILTGIVRKRNREGKPLGRHADRGSGRHRRSDGVLHAISSASNPSLIEDKAVLVRGLVLPEENAPPKISVQDIVPLEVARVNLPSLISIRVPVNGAASADRAAALQ